MSHGHHHIARHHERAHHSSEAEEVKMQPSPQLLDECRVQPLPNFQRTGRGMDLMSFFNQPIEGCGGHGQPAEAKVAAQTPVAKQPNPETVAIAKPHPTTVAVHSETTTTANKGVTKGVANAHGESTVGHVGTTGTTGTAGHGCGHGHGGK